MKHDTGSKLPVEGSADAISKDVLKKFMLPPKATAAAAGDAGHSEGNAHSPAGNQAQEPGVTGGGGDGAVPVGGGSEGSGGFFDRLSTLQRVMAGLLLMLLFLVASNLILMYFQKWSNENLEETAKALSKINEAKEKKVSKATATPARAESKTVLRPLTSNCHTQEELQVAFYANPTVHQVGEIHSLHVGPGCLVAEISTTVSKIHGTKYAITVPVPEEEGNFYKCGNGLAGMNDSPTTCTNFLNLHSGHGQRLYFSVGDGGYLNIN